MVTEIYNEKENFKAIIFLCRYNEGIYGALLQKFKEGAQKGRYYYPTTVSGIYDLMVRH